MAGRKSKLNEELIKKAENLLKGGNYVTTVCQYLGIDESTWYRWLREGEEARKGTLKYQFYQTVKKAESEAEIRLVTELQRLANQDMKWQAIAWILERKWPEKWGRKDKHQVEHSGGITNNNVDLSSLSVEELRELANSNSGTETDSK